MSKDEITEQRIYNLQVNFINKDKSKGFKHPHRIKFYEDDNCSVGIIMPNIFFEHQDLDQYVSDLEAKLAEWESDSNATLNEYRAIKHENKQLKQQLAEKEKEIENLKTDWNKLCDYLGECIVKYDKEDINGIYSEILSKVNEIRKYDYKYNQDKISFAVAYLEIIKAFIIDKEFYFTGEDYSTVYVEDITEEIDNQIKQLKEGK